jgi:hypothetical protein
MASVPPAPQEDRIRVAVRVRPLSLAERAAGAACVLGTPTDGGGAGGDALELADPVAVEMAAVAAAHSDGAVAARARLPGLRLPKRRFRFDRVYTSATQEDVYAEVGRPLLDTALDGGFNACVLAYGQTGRCVWASGGHGTRSRSQR